MALVKDAYGRETRPSASSSGGTGSTSKSMSIGDLRKQEYAGQTASATTPTQRPAGRQKRVAPGNGANVVEASLARPENQAWKRSIRTSDSTVSGTGKSVYDTFSEGELYYRQTGRKSDAIIELEKSDPNYETDRANYRAARDKKFELYDGKWQLSSQSGSGSAQVDPLEEFKGSTDYKIWDIKKNGFDGFDFTTIYNKYGNAYTANRDCLAWIRGRFEASWEKYYDGYDEDLMRKEQGVMPRSTEYSYRRNANDQRLKAMGLPPSSFIDDYFQDWQEWVGDGTYWNIPDGEAKDWIVQQWKTTWKYDSTPEDIERKASWEMPAKVEKKFRSGKDGWGDIAKTYADDVYLSMGLPPSADIDALVGAYETHIGNQNRIQQFYGSVAASWFNIGLEYGNNDADVAYESEDGTTVTVGQLREQAFVEALDSSEFADVREMYQDRAKPSEVDEADFVNDPLGLWEAQHNAEEKQATAAEKLLGTDYVSYDAFVAAYPAMRTQLGTQNVVDEAILAAKGDGYTYADLESDLQQQRDAEMFASIGTKQDALAYVDRRASDDPLQILQDMFDGGVDFKHIRQAKNYLADQHSGTSGKEVRDAIFARFSELREKNKERTNAQTDASAEADRSVGGNFLRMFLMTAGGMGTYDPEAYQAQSEKLVDVIGEDKARKDRNAANVTWLNQNVVTPYLMGETSAMSKVEAAELYRSMIELDNDGKATADSSSRARDALIDAGASGYMAQEVASEYASESGGWQGYIGDALRSANRNPEAIKIGASPFNASMQAAKFALHQSGEDDMRTLIAQTRERVVSEGIMTSFELDQAVRQAGWGSVLDARESAKNYFVSLDYGRSIESTGTDIEKTAWQSATPAERQEIAAAVWDTYSDDVQTSYTGWFNENAMANPDVAKTNEEVLRYQGIGSVATKAVGGIFTGAVNLVDMGASIFSGRSERWKFTEEVTDFTNYITNYGRSNQSYLTEGISLASDVGAEIARMYVLNAAGSALGTAANATKAGAATAAVANSATAGRGMRFLANAGLYAVRSQPFVLTATGNYYAEAMEAGATAQQATWYAIICGGLEGGLEQLNVDQWVAKGLGGRKAAETLLSGGKNAMRAGFATKAKLISLASSFCGEFTEESLSYTASYWMQRATYNKGAEFSVDELLESGFMGGLVGLFGSAISLGSYSNSSIASEYAARYGINSANLDLAAVASRVDSWSAEKRAQESMGAKLLPLNEYASTAFDLAQADAAIRAASSRYDTFVSESQAAIDAGGKALTSIGKQITAARRSGDIDKLGKLMRQYAETKAVLQRAVSDFSAQDPTNRLARDTSIDQNTRTMAKANARMDSHDIAIYNLFQEDIAAMRDKLSAGDSVVAEGESYVSAGAAADVQYADDATIDPDAIDEASSRLVNSDSVIRDGLRRVRQADAVLGRTLEKMRAARGGNVAEFLEAQMQNGIMDANVPAQTQAQSDAPQAVDASQSAAGVAASAGTAASGTPENAKPSPSTTRIALPEEQMQAVVYMASRLGRNVEFRNDMKPWQDGYYENGTLVLNSNQRVGDDGNVLKSTVYRVLTHELTHSIEGTDEYAKFSDFVCSEYVRRGGDLQAAYQNIIDEYAEESGGEVRLDLAGARKELVSKYAERTLLTNESAIDTIVREQSGFAGRVLNWIQYQIAKTGARKAPDSDMALSLLKAERLYLKAFSAANIRPSTSLRQNAIAGTSTWDDYFGGTPAGNAMRNAQYASAAERGDTKTAQRIVDDLANKVFRKSKAPRGEDGRLKYVYIGTDGADPSGEPYSVHDPVSTKDGISLFGTPEPAVAESYTHSPSANPLEALRAGSKDGRGVFKAYFNMEKPLVIDNERGSSWHDMTKGNHEFADFRIHAYNDGAYRIEIETPESDGLQEMLFSDSEEMFEWLEKNTDRLVSVDAAAAIEIMDGGDSDTDDPFAEPDYYEGFDENGNYTGDLAPQSIHLEYLIDNRDGNRIFLGGINKHEAAADDGGFASDEQGETAAVANTRNYSRWAFVHDYDSVDFRNIVDTAGFADTEEEILRGAQAFQAAVDRGGDNILVVFSPEQIKSADAITYDNNGVFIPLSERFNNYEPDTRYSIGAGGDVSSGDPFADMISRYGSIKPGRRPHARDIDVPQQTTDSNRVGLTIRSILESSHVSDDMVADLQAKIVNGEVGTYTPVSNKATTNAVQAQIARVGVDRAQEQFFSAVDTGASIFKGADTIAMGEQLLADAAARGDAESSLRLVSDLCVLGTQLGRSVQAFNILKDMGPLGSAYHMQRSVDKINGEHGKQIDSGKMQPVSIDTALMNQLLNAKTTEEQQQAEKDIISHVANQLPPTLADRLSAWRYFAMLANPTTHIRNITGNVMMAGLRGAKDIIATGIEKAAVSTGVMQHGDRSHAVYNKAAQSDRIAHAESMFVKYRNDVVNGGKLGFEDAVQQTAQNVKSESLDALMKFNSKLLEDEDAMFLRPAFVSAFTQYMVANNINPESMTAAQESAAAKWATDEAQRATFRDASALASYMNKLAGLNPAMKLVVEGLIPFKKTPVNIAKRGVDYSPIGIVEGVYMATKGVKDGKYTPAQAVDRLASGLTGTALMVMGAFLAKAGILRGKGEEKDSYETFLTDNGEQLYSINIGDVSVGISSIAPATIPLFMGAALMDAMQSDDAGATLSDVIGVVASATNPLMEMSFLSSINAALENYSNSSNTVGGKLGAVALQAGESYLSQYLPTIGGKVAAVADPVRRTAKGSAASPLGGGLDYTVRSFGKKIPGVASLLEPDVNVKGQQTTKDSFGEWALDFANKFLLPATVNVKNRGTVDNEIIRLFELTGETGILPTDPPKYFTVNGGRINLTASQYTQYSRERGQAVYSSVKAIIAVPAYKSAPPEKQTELLKKAVEKAEGTIRDLWKEKLS